MVLDKTDLSGSIVDNDCVWVRVLNRIIFEQKIGCRVEIFAVQSESGLEAMSTHSRRRSQKARLFYKHEIIIITSIFFETVKTCEIGTWSPKPEVDSHLQADRILSGAFEHKSSNDFYKLKKKIDIKLFESGI